MAFDIAFRAALRAWLRADPVLEEMLNGVFEDQTVTAQPPFLLLLEGAGGIWGAKDRIGREVLLSLAIEDARHDTAHLAATAAALDARLLTMPRIQDGYRIASLAFVRSRTRREANRRWRVLIDYRVRLIAGA